MNLLTSSTVLPWLEVGFSQLRGVFDALMTSSFVLSTFSWK